MPKDQVSLGHIHALLLQAESYELDVASVRTDLGPQSQAALGHPLQAMAHLAKAWVDR